MLVLGQSRAILLLCLCDFMACHRESSAVHMVAVFCSHVILCILSVLLELLQTNRRPAVNLVYLAYVTVSNVKVCKWNPRIVKNSLKLTLFYEFYVKLPVLHFITRLKRGACFNSRIFHLIFLPFASLCTAI